MSPSKGKDRLSFPNLRPASTCPPRVDRQADTLRQRAQRVERITELQYAECKLQRSRQRRARESGTFVLCMFLFALIAFIAILVWGFVLINR